MIPFHQVLEGCGLPQARLIRHALRRLGSKGPECAAMVHNLYEEAHLCLEHWQELTRRLAALTDPAAVADVISSFCAEFNSPRLPRPEARPGARVFGRVVPLKTFADILYKKNFYVSPEDASDAVHRFLKKALDSLPSEVLRWPLGQFLMWSTFEPDSFELPFPRPLPKGLAMSAYLGLPALANGELLLVFEYELPKRFPTRVPTFLDAYAGRWWNQWFRASARGSRYGRTRPTGPFERRSRPEVVHGVVSAAALVSPMCLA